MAWVVSSIGRIKRGPTKEKMTNRPHRTLAAEIASMSTLLLSMTWRAWTALASLMDFSNSHQFRNRPAEGDGLLANGFNRLARGLTLGQLQPLDLEHAVLLAAKPQHSAGRGADARQVERRWDEPQRAVHLAGGCVETARSTAPATPRRGVDRFTQNANGQVSFGTQRQKMQQRQRTGVDQLGHFCGLTTGDRLGLRQQGFAGLVNLRFDPVDERLVVRQPEPTLYRVRGQRHAPLISVSSKVRPACCKSSSDAPERPSSPAAKVLSACCRAASTGLPVSSSSRARASRSRPTSKLPSAFNAVSLARRSVPLSTVWRSRSAVSALPVSLRITRSNTASTISGSRMSRNWS